MDSYTSFSYVYDTFMDQEPYEEWADRVREYLEKYGLPRTAGHAAGAETFRSIATYCKEIGLEYLTV